MTGSTIDTDEYKYIFYVLGLVFVEIRATDNIKKAQIPSDIFHNTPAKIRHGASIAVIMDEINEKAARHECERAIAALFRSAEKNMTP